ncbi:MAG: DHH family phosphoesterase [Erysipelotrichaceae bacterium]|nr:DHH family phosphoesterase [Erysipelotrichaceae bacterium]
MKYLFNEDRGSLKERICEINNVTEEELDVSRFNNVPEIKVLKEFKDRLDRCRDMRFLIVGDYDCDGICATTIIKRLLDSLEIQNNHFIPSRSRQGYGLNDEIVRNAYDNGFKAIFCVDNGVSARDQLAKARDLGIKTFVIDHHEYSDRPECDAFLHPDMFEENYRDMCAAGLCTLLSESYRHDDLSVVYGGLATMADMVCVLGYNRYLITEMMKILKSTDILPVRYLLGKKEVDYDSLTYNVIPKINAVSRLEQMLNVNYVVRYLLNNDDSCLQYLGKIEEINRTRKDLGSEMYGLAQRLADRNRDIVIVKSDVFREGLCGMIANRLMNELEKPVIILSENGDELKGSGRSPNGSNFYEYLKNAEEIFSTFGGHAQAVGLSLKKDRLPELLEYVENNEFPCPEQIRNVLVLDREDISFDMLEELEELKPFGSGFMEPLFAVKDVDCRNRYIINRKYPKYRISDQLEAISFRSSDIDKDFDTIIGRIKKDDYHAGKLSMIIEDLMRF